MVNVNVFCVLAVFFSISCNTSDHRKKSQLESAGSQGIYTGFDIRGESMSCSRPAEDQACPELWRIPMDDYGLACVDQGGAVFKCDCDNYLCSIKVDFDPNKVAQTAYHEGYTMQGEWRRCPKLTDDMACPAIYGPEEIFQDACKKAGFEAYVCGCSSYLCSSKIVSSQDSDQSIYALVGQHLSIAKESMVGQLFDIQVDLGARTISGQSDLDGEVGSELPYKLEPGSKRVRVDEKYWTLLENALKQTLYLKLADAKCEIKAMISDHIIRKIRSHGVSAVSLSEYYQRSPLECREFSREFEYVQASLGVLFVLSGAKQDVSKMCHQAVVPMKHPSTNITVTAPDGCLADALGMWGFEATKE